jgi:tRNA(Ile)-lysidine synthase
VRRLTGPASSKDDIAAAIAGGLERRLQTGSARPIALAFSGGSDSTALLLATHAWALARGRRLLVLTVDHRLQPQSAAWTAMCAERAERLGLPFRALAWEGPTPPAGLPAAARAARHRLLAEAAQDAGARAILLGHTADDVLEARAMRRAGATTPEPREWSPSPAWSEGRGLFLLRPMLGLRRAALRAWLKQRGEGWIDDPANADPRYARARARADLRGAASPAAAEDRRPLNLAGALTPIPGGGFETSRRSLRRAGTTELAQTLALACVCAGGGSRLPRARAGRRLAEAVRGEGALAATLAGARILADGDRVQIVRNAGEAARGGLAPLPPEPGVPSVWDGRFEITTQRPGLEVRRLAGLAAELPADQRKALAALPAAVRPGLPAIVEETGAVSCPLLGPSPAKAAPLTEARLLAAAGLVAREPE